ncbi:hypothetical protein ACIOJE_16085 [Kitasatospora sp. NPDC087861]|uniref:hypothetical protein n=1 Tax=Kitasatospora sp. NPDC087861 TaxID=3364070 RepID=UPI0038147DBC
MQLSGRSEQARRGFNGLVSLLGGDVPQPDPLGRQAVMTGQIRPHRVIRQVAGIPHTLAPTHQRPASPAQREVQKPDNPPQRCGRNPAAPTGPAGVQDDGSFKATRPYIHSSLQRLGAGYMLTTPDQHQLMFDSAGQLTSTVDPAGVGLTMTYTGGQLTAITDGVGRSVSLGYTGTLLTSMTLPGQRTVTYQYTGNLPTAVRDQRGQTTVYGYDANGLLATVTDPLGHVVAANTYDGSGRVVSQIDGLGGKTTFSYDTDNSTTYGFRHGFREVDRASVRWVTLRHSRVDADRV